MFRKKPSNLGLIGKNYQNHHKRPVVAVCNGMLIRDEGNGTYLTEDKKRKYTYTELFGDLPIAHNDER